MKRSALWFVIVVLLIASWPATVAASPPHPPPAPTADLGWFAEYFANPGLYGGPVLTRYEFKLDHDWGYGSPDPIIRPDFFSARWTRNPYFYAGIFTFCMTVDDGGRVWVDGQLILDAWIVEPATTYCSSQYLPAGNHKIQMAYFENDGLAVARLWWTPGGAPPSPYPQPPVPYPQPPVPYPQPPAPYPQPLAPYQQPPAPYQQPPAPYQQPNGPWSGQYFNNMFLAGPQALLRVDPSLSFDWGYGSPDPSLPPDHFSARWTRDVFLPGGGYTFFAKVDDGVRLWVDGNLVINAWFDQAATTYNGFINLGNGPHHILVEYYEDAGLASICVWWTAGYAPPAGPVYGPVPGPVPGPVYGPGPGPAAEVIVDNNCPAFLWGGPLDLRHIAQAGYGGNSYWTYNNGTYPVNYGKWIPQLPAPANYQVFAHIPNVYATSATARYRILHNGARDDQVVAQYRYSNQWASLGTYYFNAMNTGNEFVLLYDNTREPDGSTSIAYDAMRFVRR
jgi:hypothetical protein